jgi:hypothetical protein
MQKKEKEMMEFLALCWLVLWGRRDGFLKNKNMFC